MIRFHLLPLTIIIPAILNAQPRLHTTSGMLLSRSQEHKLIINTVFDSNYLGYSGYFEYGWLPIRGFYIDEKAGSVIYTTFGLKYDDTTNDENKGPVKCLMTDKYNRIVMDLNSGNIRCLSELLLVVVTTSSPQNNYSGCDGTYFYFAADCNIAESWSPELHSSQYDLVEVCRTVCRACETNDESLIDSIREQIIDLTATYKKLLNYDFHCYNNNRIMTIGSISSYVYVTAEFDQPVEQEDVYKYEMVMERIAKYLVENSDGPVNYNIKICSSINKDSYYLNEHERVVVGIDDFTTEKMMHYCSKYLKKSHVSLR